MFDLEPMKKMNQEEKYKYMILLLKGQLRGEKDILANLSNASAIIMACTEGLNWAGFYLLKNKELVLGPFQGLPACNRIEIGKGVCGTAVATKQVQLVPDVHKFPGHIACDPASNSELVIPIIKDNQVYGVLDLDSPIKERFTSLEEKYFTKFVELLSEYIDWERFV